MIKMMEPKVVLVCLKKDKALIESLKKDCEKQFREIVKAECKLDFNTEIQIDEHHTLEDEDKKT